MRREPKVLLSLYYDGSPVLGVGLWLGGFRRGKFCFWLQGAPSLAGEMRLVREIILNV